MRVSIIRRLKHRLEARRRLRARSRVARGIEKLLADAEIPHSNISSSVPFDGWAVLGAREELVELAAALRYRDSVRESGLRQAEQLLTDYESPIYRPREEDELRDAARAALAAL
jgi:hypothetical protein